MKDCKHYGTMILTPAEDRDWEVIDWCYYSKRPIKENCKEDCPYKDMPEYDGE